MVKLLAISNLFRRTGQASDFRGTNLKLKTSTTVFHFYISFCGTAKIRQIQRSNLEVDFLHEKMISKFDEFCWSFGEDQRTNQRLARQRTIEWIAKD